MNKKELNFILQEGERLVKGLVETQRKILSLISKNKISKKELSRKIGVSTTAVDKNISKLKKEELLERVGPAKGGYWKIKNVEDEYE